MIYPADFKIRFPEFDTISDARIQIFIDKSILNLDEGLWDARYNEGLYYLTAHFLQLGENTANQGGGSGGTAPLSSKSIGDVSISFATGSIDGDSSAAYYNSTTYGQEYWRMLMIVGEGMVAVI